MANIIEKWANNARTTLAGSLSNVATSIVLQSGAGALFPSPNNLIGEFAKATIQDTATGLRNEIVYITARTGDVLTVTRGQDGTTAQTWSAGDTVFEGVTAGTLASFVQPAYVQSGQYIYAEAAGTTTAYTASLAPAIAALTEGMIVSVDTAGVGTNTTTTPTLNLNGLGAYTVTLQSGVALRVGDLPKFAQLQYNATTTTWVLLNPVFGNAGLVANNINVVTATSTLTIAQLGGLTRFNVATANAQTLPAANTATIGKILRLVNNNAGIATVTRAGSDTITVNSATVTTLPMGLGDTLELISDGVSTWFAVGGTAQHKSSDVYKNGSGYTILPDGLAIQRGVYTIGAGYAGQTVIYPIPFLAAPEFLWTMHNGTQPILGCVQAANMFASSFYGQAANAWGSFAAPAAGGWSFNYVAIGKVR